MVAAAQAAERAAQRSAEAREAQRLAYLAWMEEEKADRVEERLVVLDAERWGPTSRGMGA